MGGKYIRMGSEPVGKFAVLLAGWVQFAPHILASTRGAQARHPQFGIETRGNLIEPIQFIEAVTSQNTVNGQAEIRRLQQSESAHGAFEDALTSDAVIGLRRTTIQADLKIDGFQFGQPASSILRDQRPVGTDTHDETAVPRMLKHLPDTGINEWFAAAKMNLENLHFRQFVDERQGLLRGQLTGPPASR